MKIDWDGVGICVICLAGIIVFLGFYKLLTSYYDDDIFGRFIGLATIIVAIVIVAVTALIGDIGDDGNKKTGGEKNV